MTSNLQKYAVLKEDEIVVLEEIKFIPISNFCMHPSAFLSLWIALRCTCPEY